MKRRLAVLWSVVMVCWFGVSVQADPQLTAVASLTPSNAVAGDVIAFQFGVTNANTVESSVLSNAQLQVSCPASFINGIWQYFALLSVTAPGGSVSYVFDGDKVSAVTVNYGPLNPGNSRLFKANFQVPASGLVHNSTFNAVAALTFSQSPGVLSRVSSGLLQAAPAMQVVLDPIPLFTAPGGIISYRCQFRNEGDGVAHQAWLVMPIPSGTDLVRVSAVSNYPSVWYSNTPYTVEQASSDDFIRSHFMPASYDPGSPGDPSDDTWRCAPHTKTLAAFLDDPDLNLVPSGGAWQEITWRVQDTGSPEGTVFHQEAGVFCDEHSMTQAMPKQTTLRLLPNDLKLTKIGGTVQLNFVGTLDDTYEMQRSENLTNWTNLGAPSQLNPGFFQFMDVPPSMHGFYRISTAIP